MDGVQLSSIDGLIGDLQKDNTASFHILEGDVDSDPGLGIPGYYDGPFYSYYRFPQTFSPEDADESDTLEAYELLYETISSHGPFDGVLGFSHGSTLAAGFLIHHAKEQKKQQQNQTVFLTREPNTLFRCAIFVNSLPRDTSSVHRWINIHGLIRSISKYAWTISCFSGSGDSNRCYISRRNPRTRNQEGEAGALRHGYEDNSVACPDGY
ncbi:Serine hydrolase FSH [Penicillium citrinum]|uniref:Serine hydrolase FSH n=1 Tax=Penicillium citrinum TaxID=5077 RepID=A0A9W9P3M8_PENCI|nr:Serine hydrolase FSH [Penicillium citrinum]KAJ5234798.1 Serine hydrolase FSH [Penicillium citrinum]